MVVGGIAVAGIGTAMARRSISASVFRSTAAMVIPITADMDTADMVTADMVTGATMVAATTVMAIITVTAATMDTAATTVIIVVIGSFG